MPPHVPANPLRVDSAVVSALTGLPRGAALPPRQPRREVDASFFRLTVGPLLLMTTTPLLVIAVWMAVLRYDGSVAALAAAGPAAWWAQVPMPTATALAIILGWIASQWALLRWLPGPTFLGPVSPQGDRPVYRKNGVAAWFVSHGLLFGVAWPLGWIDPGALFDHYGAVLVTLNLGALALCGLLYVKGARWPTGRDVVFTGNPIYDFFQGPELHPRLLDTNLKQLVNCRVSMMGWSAICLCFAVRQWQDMGSLSWGMAASTVVLVAYLLKFFVWETGYFQSMDIIHDRFGYYICWGVLVWVPAIYCLHALYLVQHPSTLSAAAAGVVAVAGLVAIYINYDADEQRQRVRATNGETTIWGKPPALIRAPWTSGDGTARSSLLLASGWWGVARHFHYVPEIALAAAWTFPVGFDHALPWFYVIFLTILLMDRARRDEKKCAKKYTSAWVTYCGQVRWRVFPGIH